MSESEYISVLWRVIGAQGMVIAALIGILWRHILVDRGREAINRARDMDVQKCKDALGINGR